MEMIEKVRAGVATLYNQQIPGRDEWGDWIYPNHTLVVAKYARAVAQRHGVDADRCEAVALLHDLGDALTSRHDPAHEQVSLTKAEGLLVTAGYDNKTVRRLVDDALRYHSCHGDNRPQSDEGKVLATADAMAHFLTDFYTFMEQYVFGERNVEAFHRWAAEKIERDYNVKIFYQDEREAVKPAYMKLQKLFN